MKIIYVLSFTFLVCTSCNSQTAISDSATRRLNPLSSRPTSVEFVELYVSASQGQLAPSEAITFAAQRGDSCISGLMDLLNATSTHSSRKFPIAPPNPLDSTGLPVNKAFAVLSLEAIGTTNAFGALQNVASAHPNPEIRLLALNSLANTYHHKTDVKRVIPGNGFIPLFFGTQKDSTYIGLIGKSAGQIAKEGLNNWLGLDFDDPQFASLKTKGGKKLSSADVAAQWWKDNSSNLVWDNESRHFRNPSQ